MVFARAMTYLMTMQNEVGKKLRMFLGACEHVFKSYGYEDESVASYECTHIAGVIYGAAERCDLKEHIEMLPAEVYGNAHTVIRCCGRIIDFTFSQFDPTRKWPVSAVRPPKGLVLTGDHQAAAGEVAIQMAEDSELHRQMMDEIVKKYVELSEED